MQHVTEAVQVLTEASKLRGQSWEHRWSLGSLPVTEGESSLSTGKGCRVDKVQRLCCWFQGLAIVALNSSSEATLHSGCSWVGYAHGLLQVVELAAQLSGAALGLACDDPAVYFCENLSCSYTASCMLGWSAVLLTRLVHDYRWGHPAATQEGTDTGS
jgi:hypothetical protein